MTSLNFSKDLSKDQVFQIISQFIDNQGLKIVQTDLTRPWGGFLVLDESQIKKFKELFFSDIAMTESQYNQKLSPKLLLVAPGQRLSWQYHFRRAELWNLIGGESGIVRSHTDEETDILSMALNETISLQKGERHRLVGLENWGVVAEIWMHSDPQNPSDESDIVRIQDDYSRR